MSGSNKRVDEEEIDIYSFEKEALKSGLVLICGVDEAGRGPLAGPVVSAAVILDPNSPIEGLGDSKKIKEKDRERLFDEIKERALFWAVGEADHTEIDEINILQATFRAMERAVAGIGAVPDLVMIDGDKKPNIEGNVVAIVKGDARSASIGAASIIAKVTRDRMMKQLALQYPGYGFEKHKGYPTKAHYEAIKELGITPIHRKSFLKKLNKK